MNEAKYSPVWKREDTANVFTMSLLMTAVLEYTGSIIAPTIMHFFMEWDFDHSFYDLEK